ncbi:hypothetical protein LAZ67_4002015 [Cordylochernes scorpioides]|uniref:RNA-directed DNA polymerase n=1 Tax=Cordylochernes scorpioides TaxID=51811 RepID=A0ABY6KCN3_9ARAC|nr:hypothetical protein LAZ67_4002015 [Cordylochernes scorpioides]
MNIKKEATTQVGSFFVQHLPRNPSMFSGEGVEDPRSWLKGYERVAKHNQWDETLCLANVYFYLTGTALKWYENNEESIQTWTEFMSQLENVFGKNESSRLRAEKILKTRAQLKGESTEYYIQDVLRLCKEVDPQMNEEDKISHLMKGIAEELYQALIPRDVHNTEQFVTECRRIESIHCKRVTPTKYERLPNVASLSDHDDRADLSSMIRQIVREEVQRALGSTREEPKISSIEDMVKEEIGRTLAPISKPRRSSPQKERPREFYNNRYVAQTIRPQQPKQVNGRRDTNEWRTTEGKPICFHCGRPGHVVRYCRDKRREYEGEQTWNYKQRDRLEPRTFYNSRSSQEPNDDRPRENRRRYRSPSPYTGRKGQYSSPDRRPSQSPRRPQQLTSLLELEYRIEPASIQLIEVASRDIPNDAIVVAECRKELLLERELTAPSSVISLTNNRGKLWVVNWSPYPKLIPQGMHVADSAVIEDSQLCTLADCNQVETEAEHSEDPKISEFFIDDSLDESQKEKLRNLLKNYTDIFEFSKRKQFKDVNVKHRINTGDHLPTKQRPYRVAPRERQIIQDEVNKMEKLDIIQPSESPWASPVVLIRKKDGSWRFCVDYRRLNKITKKDVYPLPRIDDTLDCLRGARFYSSMDLQSGYWQIDVEESDREKTAFITPDGLYEFKVMPFGLCNAPATFERMIDNLLKGLKWTICLCYLDDIIVFSDGFEEHLRRLQLVLNCLKKAGLCLNSKKCKFGAKTITVLGHEVSENGIRPDQEKIRAVRDFATPRSLKEVRSFLGLSSYYRRFIPNYAHVAQPLNDLLKKDSAFNWNQEEQNAFEALKSALISEPALGHFDYSSPTEIHTDASNYGIGAVLVQIQKGKERAIAYASRTLNKAEKNYSTTERECLAIIWAINKFRPYVFGQPFTIVTDHHSLCWLTNLKDPCGRLARWALRLQEFDVTVVYKSGRKHQDADCLSRSPLEYSEDMEEDIPSIVTLQNFSEEQMNDQAIRKIADKLQSSPNNSFVKIDNTLYRKNYDPMGKPWLFVVPRHLRQELLKNFHDSPTAGHLGFTKTYDRIRKKYYWPGMYRTVRRYVAHCSDCQRRKHQPQLPSGHLQPIPVPEVAFEKVGMDLLGRFPTSEGGNRWIIVCTDYLTKYAITKALPTSESMEVAKFFIEDVILKHGAPRELITDRGRNFTSSMISDLNNQCRITHRKTTAYHPQTNGLTERLNKTIADMLSMYVDVNHKDWDRILPFVTFAYNTAKQESTGFTPFFLVHGREAETPLDVLFPKLLPEDDDFIQTLGARAEEARKLARIHSMRSQGSNKHRYDAHHRNIIYQPGDLVWIFIPVRKVGYSEKLMRRYFGPYKVTRKISDVTYEVETFGNQQGRRKTKDLVHIGRMKPYLNPEDQEDQLEDDSTNFQEEDIPTERTQQPQTREEISGPITRSRALRLRISRSWLKGYERVAKHNQWDETLCLANVYFYLTGTALKWYENNEESIQTWTEFMSQLENVFGKNESSRLRAEKILKTRAQLKGESTEYYIQDVLRLCKEVDPQMNEEDKISHLMKGIAEELYQALIPRDVHNTEQFVTECRRIESIHCKRVTPTKYERLPNVASLSDHDDRADLSSMIRQIVREEVQRALGSTREEPKISTIEDMVKEEIGRTLAPISKPRRSSPQKERPREFYNNRYVAQTIRPQQPKQVNGRRDTNEWRTTEGKPICFHCGRPGHVVRYCRDKRREYEGEQTWNYKQRDRLEPRTFYNSRSSQEPNDDLPRENRRRYRSPSPYTGRKGQYSSPDRRPSQSPRRSQGKMTRALVDSGASYSVISERFRLKLRKIMFAETDVTLRVANGKIVRPKGRCTLKLDLNGLQESFEFVVMEDCSHEVILGWNFLKLSRAIIDSADDTLFLEKCLFEDTPKNSSPLYSELEYRIEPASIQLIEVASRDIPNDAIVVAECRKELLLERELTAPSSVISLTNNRGKLWVVNWSPYPKLIPQGMHVADSAVIEDSQLCTLADCNQVETEAKHSEDPKISEFFIDDSLVESQKEKLRNLLKNYTDIFEFSKRKQFKDVNVKHRINTGDHLPTKQRPYRVAPRERQIIQDEVNKMEKLDIIQPSESPWASPVVLIRKKDGSWRFCVDYRRLNKITKKDVYPLPRIDDTLDCLRGARFYSSMDLQSGYWQIDVEESDREKTAFITPDGLYEFKVMPFGLCNAPATFERMIDNLLKGLKWTICLCYLDDIIVFSDGFEEHLRRLQLVLNCLKKAGLCLNSKKCKFGAKTITVLGHEVSENGIRPDQEKIRAVRDFATPRSLKEVRSFLGLSSYYRRFIPNYAHVAQPLNDLLKKDSAFNWNQEEQNAFEALKSALISEPALGHFDYSSPTEIHTDASNYGIGAVLVQIQKGKERAIAYASRTLNKAEKNYSTTERECLAIIWAINKFRPYVFGQPFTIVTDHHSLCWLTNLKDPCGRLARWALRLQEFDVTVVYKSGRKHQDADCLSRSPLEYSEDMEEDIPSIVTLQNFSEEQMNDQAIRKIADKLQSSPNNSFVKIDNTLYRKNYDPMGETMAFDCQRRKHQPQLPSGHLQPIPVPEVAFEKVGMDLLGRFPTSEGGNRWIIVCTDYLTKYAITKALPTSESMEVAKFFIEDVILKHGAPRELITDRGRNFTSSMISDLNNQCRITHRKTTAYHPQTNGLTERLNKTIADMLSMYVDVNHKDWDRILPFVTFAYNTAKQESTGFTPFFLVHGREAETPLDVLFPKLLPEDDDFIQTLGARAEEARKLARIHSMRSQGSNKHRYDAHHRNIIYQPGDLVWIFIPVRKVGYSEKLMRRYFGPYKVTRKISDVTYEVETFGNQLGRRKTKDLVHIGRMKPYLNPEDQEDQLEEDPEDDSTNFQEEDIPTERTQQPQTREEISGPITRSRALRLRISGMQDGGASTATQYCTELMGAVCDNSTSINKTSGKGYNSFFNAGYMGCHIPVQNRTALGEEPASSLN